MQSRRGIVGMLVLLVVVIGIWAAVAVFAGVLDLGKSKKSQEQSEAVDQQVQDLKTLGVSDEVSAIETDLDKTNLEKINQELPQVDKEASAGL